MGYMPWLLESPFHTFTCFIHRLEAYFATPSNPIRKSFFQLNICSAFTSGTEASSCRRDSLSTLPVLLRHWCPQMIFSNMRTRTSYHPDLAATTWFLKRIIQRLLHNAFGKQSIQMEVITLPRSGRHLATHKNHLGHFRITFSFKWITASLSPRPIRPASPESRHFGILLLQILPTCSWQHTLLRPTFSALAPSSHLTRLLIRNRFEGKTSCFLFRRHTIQQMNRFEAAIQAPLGQAQASKWNTLSPTTSNRRGLQLQRLTMKVRKTGVQVWNHMHSSYTERWRA